MTGHTVRTRILEPVLDARALNIQQARLVANPTVETDSIVEHLAAVRRDATRRQRRHIDAVVNLLEALLISNAAEGSIEQDVAGTADRLAAELHRARTVGPRAWGAKRTARELRPALADLCNPVIVGRRREVALAVVRSVAGRVGSDVLWSGTVRHELGERKFAMLAEVLEVPA